MLAYILHLFDFLYTVMVNSQTAPYLLICSCHNFTCQRFFFVLQSYMLFTPPKQSRMVVFIWAWTWSLSLLVVGFYLFFWYHMIIDWFSFMLVIAGRPLEDW
jgi:hypothetical protein